MTTNKAGVFCYSEITSQPQAWVKIISLLSERSDALREFCRGYDEVLFAGCGSALNVAYSGAAIFQALTATYARATPAAELFLFPDSVLNRERKTLVVLISRSGKTSEVVQALDYLRMQGIPTLGITCQADSPLAERSDLNIVLSPVNEQAVVTTRSVTGMILTLQYLAAIVSGNDELLGELQRLPDLCKVRMPVFHELGQTIGNRKDLTRYAFVGNGAYYGQARESQLKIKEMTLQPADAYPMFDFRHGPQSNVECSMLVTALISDRARPQEIQFLQDMKALGGVIWALCDRADESLRACTDYLLELDSGLSELARGALYMPAIQYMAYYRALSLNFNPDEPRNLSYWIHIPGS